METIANNNTEPTDGKQVRSATLFKTTAQKIHPKFSDEIVFKILVRHGKINSNQAKTICTNAECKGIDDNQPAETVHLDKNAETLV